MWLLILVHDNVLVTLDDGLLQLHVQIISMVIYDMYCISACNFIVFCVGCYKLAQLLAQFTESIIVFLSTS